LFVQIYVALYVKHDINGIYWGATGETSSLIGEKGRLRLRGDFEGVMGLKISDIQPSEVLRSLRGGIRLVSRFRNLILAQSRKDPNICPAFGLPNAESAAIPFCVRVRTA